MVTFEVESGGYEWFGRGAGHETLTAYGLKIFERMRTQVDPKIVEKKTTERVSKWLGSRKSGIDTSLYSINAKAIDNFGKSAQAMSDAYVVFGLSLDSNFTFEIMKEDFDYLEKIANSTVDTNFLATYGMALWNVGQKERAISMAKTIARYQDVNGRVTNSKYSIVNAQGDSLIMETTALSCNLWIIVDHNLFYANI